MSTRETELGAIWKEIEFVGREWATSLGVEYPLIPLMQLEPRWRSTFDLGNSQRSNLRTHALECEVLRLKYENTLLKRSLAEHGLTAPPAPLSAPAYKAN